MFTSIHIIARSALDREDSPFLLYQLRFKCKIPVFFKIGAPFLPIEEQWELGRKRGRLFDRGEGNVVGGGVRGG